MAKASPRITITNTIIKHNSLQADRFVVSRLGPAGAEVWGAKVGGDR